MPTQKLTCMWLLLNFIAGLKVFMLDNILLFKSSLALRSFLFTFRHNQGNTDVKSRVRIEMSEKLCFPCPCPTL